jgi:hypothetical protein
MVGHKDTMITIDPAVPDNQSAVGLLMIRFKQSEKTRRSVVGKITTGIDFVY